MVSFLDTEGGMGMMGRRAMAYERERVYRPDAIRIIGEWLGSETTDAITTAVFEALWERGYDLYWIEPAGDGYRDARLFTQSGRRVSDKAFWKIVDEVVPTVQEEESPDDEEEEE